MPARPRLLIVSFSTIRADARVLRQVRLFAGRYELTTCGYGEAPDGVDHHVRIPDELVYWRTDRRLLLQRRFAAAYRRNEVIDHLWDRLPRDHFEVVLADDVDTVPLALAVRPRRGVHADLHEYAPRQKEDLRRWRWFVGPYVDWLCRNFVTRCRSVTTVGEGIAREYARVYGLSPTVVTNAAPYADLSPTPVGRPVRLVHSGNAAAGRGLAELVDGVLATPTGVTLDLYLVPTEPALVEDLRRRAAGTDRVRVHDPVPYAELVATLNRYDVGVHVLPPSNFNNAWALPNKVFDYVQARLAVVVGPSPEMAALVHRYSLGTVARDFSAAALTETLVGLDPHTVARMKVAADGAAGQLSAEEQVAGWSTAIGALTDS